LSLLKKNQFIFKSILALGALLALYSLEQQAQNGPSGLPKSRKEAAALLENAEKIYRNQPLKALELLNQIQNPKLIEPKIQGDFFLLRAKCYKLQGENHRSINDALKAESLYMEQNDSGGLMSCYSVKGNVYFETFALDAAAASYIKAHALARSLGRQDAASALTLNLGNIYAQQKQSDKAKSYYLDALESAKSQKDSSTTSYVLNNLGVLEEMNQNLPSALNYYQNALDIDIALGDTSAIASDLQNMGQTVAKQKRCATALRYLEKSLFLRRRLQNQTQVYYTMAEMAEIHRDCFGRTDSVLRICGEILEGYSLGLSQDTLTLRNCHRMLAAAYTEVRNAEAAIPHYITWRLLDSILQVRESETRLLEIQSTFDSEHQQRKNDRLAYEKILLEARSERLHAVNLALIGGILFLVALGGLFYYRKTTSTS